MLKKPITYDDYDGNSVTEDFWFHITKGELLELFLTKGEGFDAYIKKISRTSEVARILPIFKEIIALSVGYRNEDTKTFVKSADYTQGFMASEAYSELFMEFMTNVPAFVAFISAIMPKALVDQIDFETGQLKTEFATNTSNQVKVVELPAQPKEEARPFEDYSHEELMEMSQKDFDKLTTGDPRKMTKGMLEKAYLRQMRPIN